MNRHIGSLNGPGRSRRFSKTDEGCNEIVKPRFKQLFNTTAFQLDAHLPHLLRYNAVSKPTRVFYPLAAERLNREARRIQ